MPSLPLKDSIEAHIRGLFADTDQYLVTVIRNLQDPTPPRSPDCMHKTWVVLHFPPTMRKSDSIGGGINARWEESGAVMVFVLRENYSAGDDQVDDEIRRIEDSMRNQVIGDVCDILDFTETDTAPGWGGNWRGVSLAIGVFAQY